jgi:hypothetical protein
MKRELSQDNEAAASFCPLFIISNVSLIDQAMDGKVGCMGRKADPVRNFYFPKSNGRKEKWVGVIHCYITTFINSKSEY